MTDKKARVSMGKKALGIGICEKLEKTIGTFRIRMNDPVWFQLEKPPRNFFFRIIKGLLAGVSLNGYRAVINERIVEIPFVYSNLELPAGARILDFGCCESKVSIELASLGYAVTGVDMNDYAFEHPNLTFKKGNFFDMRFEDGAFEAVVAISAVEHCGLPESYGSKEFFGGDGRVMNEFKRILKTGGRLFLTVPFGKRALVAGPLGYRVYDGESLKELLGGFRAVKTSYFVGMDRKNWLPVSEAFLLGVDSVAEGFVQGVACVVAEKP